MAAGGGAGLHQSLWELCGDVWDLRGCRDSDGTGPLPATVLRETTRARMQFSGLHLARAADI